MHHEKSGNPGRSWEKEDFPATAKKLAAKLDLRRRGPDFTNLCLRQKVVRQNFILEFLTNIDNFFT
jgi:hypothetical protein